MEWDTTLGGTVFSEMRDMNDPDYADNDTEDDSENAP